MVRIVLFIAAGIMAVGCGPQKKSSDGNLHVVTVKNTKYARRTQPDTITYTYEKLPITGRSEGGTLPALQGTWLLQAINDTVLAITSSVHPDRVPRASNDEQRDSTSVSEIRDGVIVTTTTVYKRAGSAEYNITPPQGSAYHIPERPSISFFGSNETFTGFTGCNKMGGRFTLSGSRNINFRSAAPSTRMVCIGDYNESAYIEALQKVNMFKREGEQLLLMQGSKVLLQFVKM